MAPFLGGIFRSGRTTPTSAGGSTPDSLTPKSGTQRDRAPPSAYKRSQPSPALTTTPTTPRSNAPQSSRTSPAPLKVKDFAWIGIGPLDPPGPPPERPLPPTPDISPLKSKGHVRSTSGASALSSRSSAKRDTRPSPSQPNSHLLPTAFTPLRAHKRAASGPSGPSSSPLSAVDVRQRSFTVQDTGTPPLVKSVSASRLAMSGPSQITTPSKAAPPVQPLSGLGRILSTPESKRRPAKLTLRTSNLTPPRTPTRGGAKPPLPLFENESVDVVSHFSTRAHVGLSSDKQDPDRCSIDSNHTITERNAAVRRVESDQTLRPSRSERPRSSSYGDIPSMKEALALDQPPTVAVPVLPAMPMGSSAQMPSKSSRTRPSPDKTTAAISGVAAPTSPAHTLRPPPSQPFETISLPWGLSSTIALSQELGPRFDELIAFTLKRLPPAPPRVLRPSVLKTSAHEDRRLRVELGRLRAKYDSITHHRDGLIAALGVSDVLSDPSKLRKTLESLRKAVTRCDRIARQIFICNDQIRQIEVQGEAHVVGTLRVALDRAQEAARSRVSSLSGTSGSEAESDGATSCESSETGHELSHVNIRRVTFVQTPQPREGSGVDEGDLSRELQVAQNEANRLSVATIISLNQLGFPIPPDRDIESPSETIIPAVTEQGALAPPIALDPAPRHSTLLVAGEESASAKPGDEPGDPDNNEELHLPLTGRSASLSQLQVPGEAGDEIVIYPPSHRRSSSLPVLNTPSGLDLPHTPWNDKYECAPPVIKSAPRSSQGMTSPLRVKAFTKARSRATGGRSVSLKAQRRLSDTTKRARRGRESQLDTPESILLSLATAGLWTKADIEEMEFRSP